MGHVGEALGQLGQPRERGGCLVDVGWDLGEFVAEGLCGCLSLGDVGFEFADPVGDLPSGGRGEVIGFEVDDLALQAAGGFGDLAGDLGEPGGDGGSAPVFVSVGVVEAGFQ